MTDQIGHLRTNPALFSNGGGATPSKARPPCCALPCPQPPGRPPSRLGAVAETLRRRPLPHPLEVAVATILATLREQTGNGALGTEHRARQNNKRGVMHTQSHDETTQTEIYRRGLSSSWQLMLVPHSCASLELSSEWHRTRQGNGESSSETETEETRVLRRTRSGDNCPRSMSTNHLQLMQMLQPKLTPNNREHC